MNSQFKKGVLEMIVLIAISDKDRYGYEIVNLISEMFHVKEGTIYPLLKRLTNEKYFETYLMESAEGPPRKYYRITVSGKARKRELIEDWHDFVQAVTSYIEGVGKHD